MTEKNDRKVVKTLHKNYQNINKQMVSELHLASEHGGLTGSFRESLWMKFFRNIVPKKFSLAKGVLLIDSNGNVSKEIDIAIFDEQYTPYILQYGELKFIPIEAVAAVIECKSKSPETEALQNWSKSIDKLEANPTGIARVIQGLAIGLTNETQQRTNPIKILVALKDTKSKDFDKKLKGHFDFILRPEVKETKRFTLTLHNEDKSLGWWLKKLNSSKKKQEELDNIFKLTEKLAEKCDCIKLDEENLLTNTLKDLEIPDNEILTLTFQLGQLLMLINNPMMFPHFAYAKVFQDVIKREDSKAQVETK